MATKHHSHVYSSIYPDVEKGALDNAHFQFAEKTIRQGFVRKVFGILAAQLAVTFLVSAWFVSSKQLQGFIASNTWILGLSAISTLVIMLVFTFSEDARRNHPTNLFLLGGFTLAESVLVGAICARYSPDIVLLAVGITAAVTVGLCFYAFTTKGDFTMIGGWLYCGLLSLLVAGLLKFFVAASWYTIGVSAAGSLLFSAYIVYDVQMLMGGDHKFSLSPDEYVFGAIAIYLDVINLFLQILQILAEINRRSN